MSIIVTGGSGLLGKSLKKLKNDYKFLSSKEFDLTNYNCKDYLSKLKPSKIIHLAGKVSGIIKNSKESFDFISVNNKINSNVIEYCVSTNTPIIFASSSCVYPKNATKYPMTEDMVYHGEPEETNDGYAYAKRFAGNMLRSAKKQYGLDYTILYFCNLFGENDDFHDQEKSHLITSLIKKFHDAKVNNTEKVELYGTGHPYRQFMYCEDAANAIIKIEKNNLYGEYNVSCEENLTISEMANIVKNIVGYSGSIQYNGVLDGVFRKDICSEKIKNHISNLYFTPFEEGVKKTYKYFLELNNVEINA